jgi:hypothetical protein
MKLFDIHTDTEGEECYSPEDYKTGHAIEHLLEQGYSLDDLGVDQSDFCVDPMDFWIMVEEHEEEVS